jgi:hypothetical protein
MKWMLVYLASCSAAMAGSIEGDGFHHEDVKYRRIARIKHVKKASPKQCKNVFLISSSAFTVFI